MFEKFKGHPVGHVIEPSLNEERFATRAMLARITEQEKAKSSTVAEAVSYQLRTFDCRQDCW